MESLRVLSKQPISLLDPSGAATLDQISRDVAKTTKVALGLLLVATGATPGFGDDPSKTDPVGSFISGALDRVTPEQEVALAMALDYGGAKSRAKGQFSIIDWKWYPAGGPKPEGPFRVVEGEEYAAARAAANKANGALHKADPSLAGQQIHEVRPVKFGGSATSMANKVVFSLKVHMEYTKFWNLLMRAIKRQEIKWLTSSA